MSLKTITPYDYYNPHFFDGEEDIIGYCSGHLTESTCITINLDHVISVSESFVPTWKTYKVKSVKTRFLGFLWEYETKDIVREEHSGVALALVKLSNGDKYFVHYVEASQIEQMINTRSYSSS